MKTLSKLLVLFLLVTACGSDDSDSTPLNAQPCDSGLAIDDSNAANAAIALDLCDINSARFIRANASLAPHSNQIGILENFGNNISPRKGDRMFMLSTGIARSLTQPGNCGSSTCLGYGSGSAPAGFPQDIDGCPSITSINDDVGLEISLTVPDNANGFTFDFIYFTFDYPSNACTVFSDQFVATLNTNPTGSINGNIAFDSDGIPIGVNCNFINPNLSDLMVGTGFDFWGDAGTTGWVRTSAPVTPGTDITLRFIIWDSSDQSIDSSVIIDNFLWTSNAPTVGSVAL